MRWIMALLGVVLALGTAFASVYLTGTTGECTYLKPGATKMLLLTVEEENAGQYIVTLTSDGLTVFPSEIDLYLGAGEKATRWIKVEAPVTVIDDYYTLDVSVYRADTKELVESRQYCFHVYKGVLATEAPDVVFGYSGLDVKDNKVYITLYVTNMGRLPVSVKLDSDYGRTVFERNPVVVKGYRTVEVKAEIPVDEYMPEFVTFYAFVGDAQKEVTVKLPVPETLMPRVEIVLPETITVDSPVSEFIAKVINEGDAEITVTLAGKQLPLGVGLYSDKVTIAPGEAALVTGYIVPRNVIRTGVYLIQVCVEDSYGAELTCKYTKLIIEGKKEVKTAEKTTEDSIIVTMTIENGAKAYRGAAVEVEAPKGWTFTAEPETLDLEPYETREVTVRFVPAEGAQDGLAVIKVVAPDGTVLAQKTVQLRTSALTGYATAGASSALGWVIAAIVVALIIALVIKKGKEAEAEGFEELEELKRRE